MRRHQRVLVRVQGLIRQRVFFLSFVSSVRRCSLMPRRGWSTADVPASWIQIVRGPMPRSEQWPRASATRLAVPRVPSSVQAQTLKPILTSAKDKVNPEAARDAARNKVSKLEKDLEVLGGSTGPAVDVPKSELEKARQAAKVPLLNVQISSTQDFIRVPRDVWQNWKRNAQPKPSCSRRAGSVCASWRQPVVRKKGLHLSFSHPVGFGDPSPDSAADGHSIAGRARRVGEGPVRPGPKMRQRLSVPHVAEDTIPPMPNRGHFGSSRFLLEIPVVV